MEQIERILGESSLHPSLHIIELTEAAETILDNFDKQSGIGLFVEEHDINLKHIKSFYIELKEYAQVHFGIQPKAHTDQRESFSWLANEQSLKELCSLLYQHDLIDSETNLYQILKGSSSATVRWLKSNRMLTYLFQRLVDENYLEDYNKTWKLTSQYVVKKDAEMYSSKDLSEANRNNVNPRGAQLLEDVLEKTQKLASLGQG